VFFFASLRSRVVSNMHLHYICFRKNGFALEEDPNAPPGCRYKLKSVPYSKNTMFGIEGRIFEFCGFYL
jgi:DNA mismatch repair protein PMS2